MKRYMLALITAFAVSCGPFDHNETSQTIHEDGTCKQLIYQPAHNGRTDGAVGYNFGRHGGFTYNPGHDIHMNAVYSVVFQCQHGTFAIDNREDVWKKMKEGAAVDIAYQEVYHVNVDANTRTLVDYKFIDANVKE